MREFTVPPVAAIAATSNLTDPVWDNAEKYPRTPQFARKISGRWRDISCAQFRDEVVAVARGLIAAGIEPGQRVALMSRTRYEWTLIDYSIWAAGAVTVPIYETSGPEQVQWILGSAPSITVASCARRSRVNVPATAETLGRFPQHLHDHDQLARRGSRKHAM